MMSPATSRRTCLGLFVVGIGLALPACSKPDAPGTVAAPQGPAAPPSAAQAGGGDNGSKSGRLLANWPRPDGLLVISGEMDGYLEPCGCTQGQVGGLIRRLDFVDRLRSQYGQVALIDLGTLIKDPAAARGGFEQAKIKYGIALKALSTLKYDAIALSAEDLKIGVMEALGQLMNNLADPARIVVANVQPGAGFESKIEASRIIPAGSVKLGVTSVIDPELLQKLNDPDKGELLASIKRPDDSLGPVLAEMEPKSDYQVLMVQGPPELAKRLATSYPGFDVVVSTSQFADPVDRDPLMLNGGKTMLVQVGRRGKSVGAVGFFSDGDQKMRFYLVSLNSRFDGPGTAVKKVIEDEYRSMLKAAGTVEAFPRHDYTGGSAGATFVGAETCKQCHPNTYARWATTKHAQAFASLEKDPKPNTTFDAECISCHTTGFEYNSGWRSEAATAYLKGNQCENCHGPGSRHIVKPDDLAARAPMKLTAEQADKGRMCIRCHDEDNSPKFNFATYYGQIVHKGLDEYKDPKVHQGISPRVARKPADAGAEK
ncbi:Perchlorate reductase subunit gamma precursor [Aquisphaera giovannonii]|uniref:Perchlorate reductase subunit gamma n=1 Tax=Aquisphaera giovannonii TaxID=406548 RepID=A0A5B9W262_9BACT|nr:multiheme c-type cytochrome [Aquisphaera giovannonii]QEH34211.1 Perchlorate reductase subunit gamma precursor [Aquisphaera giovannonii]